MGRELLPGLPVSAVQFLCPVTAASFLLHRRSGAAGVAALLERSFDFTRITDSVSYVSVLLLIPAAYGLSYIIILMLGRPVAGVELNPLAIPLLLVVFFIGGLAEELGWSGYALDPMQRRWGALRAALLLGAFWAVWHWVPLLQAERSWAWIAWWSLSSVSLRLLHVWLYNNTGKSVFGQALFHAAPNVAWQVLPTAYEPAITGPILFVAAVVAWVNVGGIECRERR